MFSCVRYYMLGFALVGGGVSEIRVVFNFYKVGGRVWWGGMQWGGGICVGGSYKSVCTCKFLQIKTELSVIVLVVLYRFLVWVIDVCQVQRSFICVWF